MAKVPHFSTRCRLSDLMAQARQAAEARAVRRTDVACTLGLAALLTVAALTR